MTDVEKIQRVEYRSHLLQVKTCGALMNQMCLVLASDHNEADKAQIVRDLSVAVANVGGRVPQ